MAKKTTKTATATQTNRPTRTYTSLDAAYDHFNTELFAGELPHCLVTLQRHKGARGYFHADRFASVASGEQTDEIALNPQYFATHGTTEVLSVLVHEMAHLWQQHFGKPSRNGYHNKEWGAKMREIGLIPDSLDKPGTDTGQKVSHDVEPGGRFAVACEAFLAKNSAVLYHDRLGDGAAKEKAKKKNASKTKYTCPSCDVNAWAKPGVILLCGVCNEELEPEERPEDEDGDGEE